MQTLSSFFADQTSPATPERFNQLPAQDALPSVALFDFGDAKFIHEHPKGPGAAKRP
jgi:hypothetical protein